MSKKWRIGLISTDKDLKKVRQMVISHFKSGDAETDEIKRKLSEFEIQAFETSEFVLQPHEHSHDVCITNIDRIDIVIIIINKHFGGKYIYGNSESITQAESKTSLHNPNIIPLIIINQRTFDESKSFQKAIKKMGDSDARNCIIKSDYTANTHPKYISERYVKEVEVLDFVGDLFRMKVDNYMKFYTNDSEIINIIDNFLMGVSRYLCQVISEKQKEKIANLRTSADTNLTLDYAISKRYFIEPQIKRRAQINGKKLTDFIKSKRLNNENLMISGIPGSGKSTIIAKVFDKHCSELIRYSGRVAHRSVKYVKRSAYHIPLYLQLTKNISVEKLTLKGYFTTAFSEYLKKDYYPLFDWKDLKLYFYIDCNNFFFDGKTANEIDDYYKSDVLNYPHILSCCNSDKITYLENNNIISNYNYLLELDAWDKSKLIKYVNNYCSANNYQNYINKIVDFLSQNKLYLTYNTPLLISILLWLITSDRVQISGGIESLEQDSSNIYEKSIAYLSTREYPDTRIEIGQRDHVVDLYWGKTIPLSIMKPYGFVGREKELNVVINWINTNKKILIHGLGGIGKTTLVEAALSTVLRTHNRIIIMLAKFHGYRIVGSGITGKKNTRGALNYSFVHNDLITLTDVINAINKVLDIGDVRWEEADTIQKRSCLISDVINENNAILFIDDIHDADISVRNLFSNDFCLIATSKIDFSRKYDINQLLVTTLSEVDENVLINQLTSDYSIDPKIIENNFSEIKKITHCYPIFIKLVLKNINVIVKNGKLITLGAAIDHLNFDYIDNTVVKQIYDQIINSVLHSNKQKNLLILISILSTHILIDKKLLIDIYSTTNTQYNLESVEVSKLITNLIDCDFIIEKKIKKKVYLVSVYHQIVDLYRLHTLENRLDNQLEPRNSLIIKSLQYNDLYNLAIQYYDKLINSDILKLKSEIRFVEIEKLFCKILLDIPKVIQEYSDIHDQKKYITNSEFTRLIDCGVLLLNKKINENDVATIYYILGYYKILLNDNLMASYYLSKASEQYVKLIENSENNAKYNKYYARTLTNIGANYLKLEEYGKANDILEKARNLKLNLYSDSPNTNEANEDIAWTELNQGYSYLGLKKFDEAKTSFTNAYDRRYVCLTRNQGSEKYQIQVAWILNDIGEFYLTYSQKLDLSQEMKKAQIEMAIQCFNASLTYKYSILKQTENPDVFKQYIAWSQHNLGICYLECSEYEKATSSLIKAYNIRKNLSKENPNEFKMLCKETKEQLVNLIIKLNSLKDTNPCFGNLIKRLNNTVNNKY